jgi:Protein of unknown function (DUF3293)
MSHEANHDFFLNTIYKVIIDENQTYDILVGSEHVLENLGFTQVGSWAFITAWNPLPITYTLEENRGRNEELKKDLDSLGLFYLDGIGLAIDGSWQEESLFVKDISNGQAEDLAKKYKQVAYLFSLKNGKAELVYTESNGE